MNFLYQDHWQPELDNPRGCFSFNQSGGCTQLGQNSGTTALPGGTQTANFYNHFAAFLLGLPGTVSKSVQYEELTTREWQHGLFFRDRWSVTPQVTLDLGVRWEYYPIMHRADRGLERVDLDTLQVLLGGVGATRTTWASGPAKGTSHRVLDSFTV
jgi:outer membrane receptor protein involved in Fe transport